MTIKHVFARLLAATLAAGLMAGAAFAQSSQGTSPRKVSEGGTGRAALTAHGLIFGNGASPVTIYACTGFLVGTGSGADPTCRTIAAGDLSGVIGTAVQAYNANLAAISGLTTAADKLTYWTGSGTAALADFPSWARSVVGAASASAGRTAFGLTIGADVQAYHASLAAISGATTAANKLGYWSGLNTYALTDFTAFARTLLDDADAAAMRATLGLVIGTNVQAWDADLDAWAGKTAPSGTVVGTSDTQTLTNKTFDTAGAGNSLLINGLAASANTGTGAVARATSPVFVTPTLGAASATSINGLTINSTTATLALANAKTLTVSNSLTFTGTDGTSFAFPGASDTVATIAATQTLTNKTLTAPTISGGTVDNATLGATTPASVKATTLEATQSVTWSGVISPSQITSNQNDYAPTGFSTATVLRLSTDASRTITGLAGGADGRIIAIHNVGSNDLILSNESASSAAANRFVLGADATIGTNTSTTLRYDATSSRWRAIAGAGASGGGGGGSGTVTSVATGKGITGGTITSSGTIELAASKIVQDVLAWMGVARGAGVAGYYGMGFADSFGATTYVDVAGATNLDTGTAGLLKNTVTAGSDQTATHTAATTGGNTVTESQSAGAGYEGWHAFDNTANNSSTAVNAWHTSNQPYGWIKYQFGSAKTIGTYTVRSSNGFASRGPKTWTLQGSNDNSSWTTLDTQTNVAAWSSGGETRTYNIASPASYLYYKLDVTVNQGDANYLTIDQITLETATVKNNLTVASNSIALASVPATVIPVIRIKHVDTATAGTDYNLYVSRDGGTTYSSAASLTDWVTDPFETDVHIVYGAPVDVSGQPSGSNLRLKIITSNNKSLEVRDWGVAAYQ